jgi:hypothetical protein
MFTTTPEGSREPRRDVGDQRHQPGPSGRSTAIVGASTGRPVATSGGMAIIGAVPSAHPGPAEMLRLASCGIIETSPGLLVADLEEGGSGVMPRAAFLTPRACNDTLGAATATNNGIR